MDKQEQPTTTTSKKFTRSKSVQNLAAASAPSRTRPKSLDFSKIRKSVTFLDEPPKEFPVEKSDESSDFDDIVDELDKITAKASTAPPSGEVTKVVVAPPMSANVEKNVVVVEEPSPPQPSHPPVVGRQEETDDNDVLEYRTHVEPPRDSLASGIIKPPKAIDGQQPPPLPPQIVEQAKALVEKMENTDDAQHVNKEIAAVDVENMPPPVVVDVVLKKDASKDAESLQVIPIPIDISDDDKQLSIASPIKKRHQSTNTGSDEKDDECPSNAKRQSLDPDVKARRTFTYNMRIYIGQMLDMFQKEYPNNKECNISQLAKDEKTVSGNMAAFYLKFIENFVCIKPSLLHTFGTFVSICDTPKQFPLVYRKTSVCHLNRTELESSMTRNLRNTPIMDSDADCVDFKPSLIKPWKTVIRIALHIVHGIMSLYDIDVSYFLTSGKPVIANMEKKDGKTIWDIRATAPLHKDILDGFTENENTIVERSNDVIVITIDSNFIIKWNIVDDNSIV